METGDSLLLKVRGLLPSLNPALRKVGEYILRHPQEVKLLTIGQLSVRCGAAEASISRFTRELGLSGFPHLKMRLAELNPGRHPGARMVYEEVTASDSTGNIADKIYSINQKALSETLSIIDLAQIERAVTALDKTRRVDIYAAGGSFVTAESARLRFYRIGKSCHCYSDPNQQGVSASLLRAGDVAIGISNSGRTISTVRALTLAQASGATTVSITSFEKTPLTSVSDIVLQTSTQDSSFFQESMVSRIAQMFVIDVLYACLAVKHFHASTASLERSADALRKMFL